jgi:uncharacterized protein with PIN domain
VSRAISMTEQLPATANCQGPMNRQETQGGLCPRCQRELRFWLKLPPISHEEGTHRVYRCKACDRFEWVFEPPGKRT